MEQVVKCPISSHPNPGSRPPAPLSTLKLVNARALGGKFPRTGRFCSYASQSQTSPRLAGDRRRGCEKKRFRDLFGTVPAASSAIHSTSFITGLKNRSIYQILTAGFGSRTDGHITLNMGRRMIKKEVVVMRAGTSKCARREEFHAILEA